MGIFLYLKALFGAKKFSNNLKVFNQTDERVQFFMFKELQVRYAKQYKPELAAALAVLITKYLMGHDLDAVRQSAAPENRSLLDSCRPNVETEADKLMQSDPIINELVKRSLMTKFLLYSCRWGSNWIQHKEGQNTEARINRYDDGLPDVHNHDDVDKYIQCACRYVVRVEAAEQIEE